MELRLIRLKWKLYKYEKYNFWANIICLFLLPGIFASGYYHLGLWCIFSFFLPGSICGIFTIIYDNWKEEAKDIEEILDILNSINFAEKSS